MLGATAADSASKTPHAKLQPLTDSTRADAVEEHAAKVFGPFEFDGAERVLRRNGKSVPLTPKAFDLLAAFIHQPGRLLTKDELLKTVWPGTFVEESNLAYHVFVLRKALGENNGTSTYIETVQKSGYRFTAAVTTASPAAPSRPALLAPDRRADTDGPPATIPARDADRPYTFATRLGLFGAVLVPAVVLYLVAWTREGPPERAPLRAVPLTSVKGAVRAPTLSPDARFVVFGWSGERQDNPDLYVQQIGAGVPRRVTTDAGNDFSPSWSPDGQLIASLRRAPGSSQTEVWLIAPLGGGERKLTDLMPGLAAFVPPTVTWCRDSRCLFVTDAQAPAGPDAIFVVMLDSGAKRQLTHPTLAQDTDPVLSPDGRQLVFRRTTTPFAGAFYRLPLAPGLVPDGEPVRLTGTMAAGKPTWTSDSREIVFAAGGGLWRLDAMKGGAPQRLPFVGQDGHAPVIGVTGDGRQRLVYGRGFADSNVWRIDTPGPGMAGAPPVAAISTTRVDFLPSLSADGRRLAFVSDRSGDPQVWVADPDGSNAVQLTFPTFAPLPGFPRWSADGSTVAFHADPAGRPDIAVVAAAGGTPKILTGPAENGAYPSYSRDGRWMYFCTVHQKEPRIWRMPSSGGAAAQVTTNPGTVGIESIDGRDLYYVSGTAGSSSLWRQALAGGPPVKLVDGVMLANFDVIERGLYFIDRAPGQFAGFISDRPGETRLQYYDFATKRIATVARDLGWVTYGLSASRDGRTVYFARIDSAVDELMVVDDFR